LSEDNEGYVLGRGGKDQSIQEIGVTTWAPLQEPPPLGGTELAFWRSKYGPLGEKLSGWLTWPLWSPRGRVLGFVARRTDVKVIERYLLPEAAWNPIWTGLTSGKMRRIWEGSDVWVVEGLFDLLPLEWAIPENDVVLGSERAHLTDKHVTFLRRFARGWIRVVYDNDPTGRKGSVGWFDEEAKKFRPGAVARLEKCGLRAVDVRYQGKDPGEVWKRGGASAMREAFPNML
jgi:DNA primase